jgi:hypothetical protein
MTDDDRTTVSDAQPANRGRARPESPTGGDHATLAGVRTTPREAQ